MDLWQLNIFCKVIEQKSFSRAGETIHLSQPTVSSHIKDLEDHFGCRLVDRLSREALPTKAGKLLYKYARRLIALRDEMESALAEFQGKIKGHLMIGGSTIPGVYILPRIIGSFSARYPDVIISLKINATEKIINDTLSGELELGIVGDRTENKKIFQEQLIDDEMCLIVPAGHKWSQKKSVTFKMLLPEPFIVRERGSGTLRSIQRSISKSGGSIDELNIVAEMGSTEAVCQGIKNRVGVSIVSTIAVFEELKAGNLKALVITGLDLKRNFYLTTHKYRSQSPLGNAFVRCLKKELLESKQGVH